MGEEKTLFTPDSTNTIRLRLFYSASLTFSFESGTDRHTPLKRRWRVPPPSSSPSFVDDSKEGIVNKNQNENKEGSPLLDLSRRFDRVLSFPLSPVLTFTPSSFSGWSSVSLSLRSSSLLRRSCTEKG